MAKSTHVVAEATYTIPEPFETEIGRIIVRWAYLEDLIQQIVWGLLDLDPAYGRLAVREPRVSDRLKMIRDLAQLRKIRLFPHWDNFAADAATLSGKRDLVAHGAWIPTPDGNWHLERTRGLYRPEPFVSKVNRRVEPTAISVTLPALKSISSGIENLIKPALHFHDSCHAIRQTWREKRQ
jgi:hypothetical protein